MVFLSWISEKLIHPTTLLVLPSCANAAPTRVLSWQNMWHASARLISPTSAGHRAWKNIRPFVFLSGNNQLVQPVCEVTQLLTGCARGLQEASVCAQFVPTALRGRIYRETYRVNTTKIQNIWDQSASKYAWINSWELQLNIEGKKWWCGDVI